MERTSASGQQSENTTDFSSPVFGKQHKIQDSDKNQSRISLARLGTTAKPFDKRLERRTWRGMAICHSNDKKKRTNPINVPQSTNVTSKKGLAKAKPSGKCLSHAKCHMPNANQCQYRCQPANRGNPGNLPAW